MSECHVYFTIFAETLPRTWLRMTEISLKLPLFCSIVTILQTLGILSSSNASHEASVLLVTVRLAADEVSNFASL